MSEIPTGVEPVLREVLVQLGTEVGQNMRQLDSQGLRHTVNALIIYPQILPDQELFDDPDVVTAANIASDFEHGSGENAMNLIEDYTNKSTRTGVNPERVKQALEVMRDITRDGTPDALYVHVIKQLNEAISQLMANGVRETIHEPLRMVFTHSSDFPPRTKALLNRYGTFFEAANELLPKLSKSPSDIA